MVTHQTLPRNRPVCMGMLGAHGNGRYTPRIAPVVCAVVGVKVRYLVGKVQKGY